MSEPAEPPSRLARRLLIDLTPLRRSRDLRRLVSGELVSVLGTQLTTVAVPYQVYQLTRSSLDVGLVSITQLFPLIAGSLLAGSVVDAMDRRTAADGGAGADGRLQRRAGGQRRPGDLAVAVVRAAGPGGRVQRAGQRRAQRHRAEHGPPVRGGHRERHIPGPVPAGPGGGPGAWPACCWPGAGVRFVYWMDVASFGVALVAVFLISPQPPGRGRPPARPALDPGGPQLRARQAVHPGRLPDRHQRHGVRHAAGPVPGARHHVVRRRARRRSASSTPRPARAPWSARSPPAGSAGSSARASRSSSRSSPGAPPSPASGWCRGCPPPWPCWPSPAAPTSSRRCSAARSSSSPCRTRCGDAWRACRSPWSPAVPAVGDLESGAVAAAFGDTVSVVSGGLACIAGALLLARLLPGFRHQRVSAIPAQAAHMPGAPQALADVWH